jgi:prepilin-type N-terminal cleavage/methylation domain-containing protein
MRRGRAGVTLMELLIAVSLISLLSLGILLAIRVGLNALEKSNQRLTANRRAAGAQRVLEQQIAGFMPVTADCMINPGTPGTRIPFFQGEPETMRFVSSYSMQEAWRGYARILEFQVIPGAEGRGVRLVVNEILYTGPMTAGMLCVGMAPDPEMGTPVPIFRPVMVGPGSFVLADKLAYCRFAYREEMKPPPYERWRPRWVFRDLPTAIRIDMAPLEPDASKLQPLSIVTPVHVNRMPLMKYDDY